jgi:glycosyltransferase involved in cell wall biosynthesis
MTRPVRSADFSHHVHAHKQARSASQDIIIDLTHLGRHVTGIERISIEQFEKVDFTGARVRHVRANGVLSMIWRQQILLPILALLYPRAIFLFPGFPPSPWFALIPHRVVMYVHDLFLITRRGDLGLKAKLYMAAPFSFAIARLRQFQVNSEKTRAELLAFARRDARISLYRPVVRNLFALEARARMFRPDAVTSLNLVALGTVEPRKNYGAALTILDALIAQGHVGARLHIIGREGWGDATEAITKHPSVTVHGYLPAPEVKVLLENADAYLCTSHDEGLGLPLLEAQFGGLPVIAPNSRVFHEVLGASGIFIDPADPVASARTIGNAILQRGWRSKTAVAALSNVTRWNERARGDAHVARNRFATLESAQG